MIGYIILEVEMIKHKQIDDQFEKFWSTTRKIQDEIPLIYRKIDSGLRHKLGIHSEHGLGYAVLMREQLKGLLKND